MSESAGGSVTGKLVCALTKVDLGFNLEREDIAGPAMFQRLHGIPKPVLGVSKLLDQCKVLTPTQLCNALLHNFPFGPSRRKGTHVLQVTQRNPLHLWKGLT